MSVQSEETVYVLPSRIQGLGLYAGQEFRAGDQIRRVNIVREVTAEAPLQEDQGERFDHCAYPAGKTYLWGFPDRHINHSCDPNAYEQFAGEISTIVARRDIAAGEEITFDYNINTSGGDSWPCHCGAVRCRGETIGDFFKLPRDVQQEYSPCLAPWFVSRHQEKIEQLKIKAGSG